MNLTPGGVSQARPGAYQATGFGELIGRFNYGLMANDWATDSMKLFAESVLPELKSLASNPTASTPYVDVQRSLLANTGV